MYDMYSPLGEYATCVVLVKKNSGTCPGAQEASPLGGDSPPRMAEDSLKERIGARDAKHLPGRPISQ